MQPINFYTTDKSQSAILLEIISNDNWKADLKEKERAALKFQQFKASAGKIGLIFDENSQIIKAYIGGNPKEMITMAAAAQKLPEGQYKLQDSLDDCVLLAWSLAQYNFSRYKKSDSEPRILELEKERFENLYSQAESIFFLRDLINTPTSDLGPKELGDEVAKLAAKYQAKYKAWVDEELLTENFPAIYTVGKASASRPRLESFTWGNPKHPHIAIVGKGVCFDTGGLDVKSSPYMRLMKKDMGGAAHALGLAKWIMEKKLALHLEVLIPAVENSIGANAYRPGDIIKMRNGLTVEVDNTDAEGRLVLADALIKAEESNPELIINFATLTGAARIAVGTDIAAMFTNDDSLAEELMKASSLTQDPLWRLPLYQPYESLLESSIADLANCPNVPFGGAITAALFLKRFITKTKSWVHFDMGAWNYSSKPGKPEGGEAMAIRALAFYLQKKYG